MAKILNWPVPRTLHDVRGILGFGRYYHHFIRNFSDRVQPLVALAKKEKPFNWTKGGWKALDNIKHALISPDIMSFSTNDWKFILDTDVSDETLGLYWLRSKQG